MIETCQLAIIGGGPAGLAAALAARSQGVQDILIIERNLELGGVLNQCIHTGFGLHVFQEELTGPEYAARYIAQVEEQEIPVALGTTVLSISAGKVVTMVSKEEGLVQLQAEAIILGMGCRERSRGALDISGTRPAGIYTAGTVQRFMNIEGLLPGREVVILGSGDIGLIMARRMTLEGAHVKFVAEIKPHSGGLQRNIVQCLEDYGIPLKCNHTITKIHGTHRVEGVTLVQVDAAGCIIPETEEFHACDTVLLSVGLIPENELSKEMGLTMDESTGGPVVTEKLETSIEGVFACGNVLYVHDLADTVSQEAVRAGEHAAHYILK